MDHPEALSKLVAENTRGEQTKQKIALNRKLKRFGNTHPKQKPGIAKGKEFLPNAKTASIVQWSTCSLGVDRGKFGSKQ